MLFDVPSTVGAYLVLMVKTSLSLFIWHTLYIPDRIISLYTGLERHTSHFSAMYDEINSFIMVVYLSPRVLKSNLMHYIEPAGVEFGESEVSTNWSCSAGFRRIF